MADESLMSSPTISVIIPAYNAAKFISEALDSVLAQQFSSYEVIVINDGSPDTAELECALAPYLTRIRYINQENRGAAAARNTGLRAARGQLVAFIDADDKWFPNFLSRQISFLQAQNAGFVFTDALIIGDTPLAGRSFMQLQPSHGQVTPESLLSVTVTVLTSTVLARKEPIFAVGMFDEKLRRGHDFDLWLRLCKHGVRFAYHGEVLAQHRLLESGLSGDTISKLKRTISVLEAVQAKGTLTPSENTALHINMNRTLRELALEDGKQKLLDKDFAGSLRSFNEANRFGRSWKVVLVCLALQIAPDLLRRVYSRRIMTPKNATAGYAGGDMERPSF